MVNIAEVAQPEKLTKAQRGARGKGTICGDTSHGLLL